MQLSKKRLNIIPIVLGLLLTITFALAYFSQLSWSAQFFQRLDHLLYDIRYNLVPRSPLLQYQSTRHQNAKLHNAEEGPDTLISDEPASDTPILIIDLDEQSLAEQGRWPWSRVQLEALVGSVQSSGILMLGFDVLFAEAERNPVDQLLSRAQWPDAVAQSLQAQRAGVDADGAFATRLGTMETVLGFFWRSDRQDSTGALPQPIVQSQSDIAQVPRLVSMPNYSANLPLFQQAAIGAGFLSAFPDIDGVIRRVPLVVAHEQQLYGTLALEMARLLWFLDGVTLETEQVNTSDGLTQAIQGVRVGQYMLPTDAEGQILIPFVGKAGSFPYVSASDFLMGRVAEGQYDGYIALLGTSALGLKDLRTTAVGTDYPGVEIHANLLQGILNLPKTPNYFAQRPDFEAGVTLLWIMCVGILLSCVLPLLHPPHLLCVSTVVLVANIGVNAALWRYAGFDFPLGPGLTIWLWLSLFYFLRSFLLVNMQRRRIREVFGQYVPEAHVESMLAASATKSLANAGLEGVTKEMTVLFSDIRSFTTISEGLSATELKEMLDLFFTPITGIIFQHEGTIDKYVGDMVMAFWGAPLPDANHAQHAVFASMEMLERVGSLKAEFESRGLPQIDIGIGISTGQMHVGDMGSQFRRTYTVLGDAVNLGARLEGLTKYYGVKLLISERTQLLCPDVLCVLVDRIRVKGKLEPVQVYEPLCALSEASDQQLRFAAEFNWFLFLYFGQCWDEARAFLAELLHKMPEHQLLKLYQSRIDNLCVHNLEAHWDGVFTHQEK